MQSRRKLLALALSGCAGLAALGFAATSSASAGPRALDRYEVAMDGTSFHFEGDVNQNQAPADGTPFIIRGYIYPQGTFAQYGDLSGVNADGSPEFPNLVMGTWYCRGWHLQDGDAPSGPVVATTQIFDLDLGTPGRHTIVSDGIELADFDVPFQRAITGATGMFRGLRNEHSQMYVGNGLNASGGFNTVFAF